MKWLIFLLVATFSLVNSMELLSASRTSYLPKYSGYMDVSIMHLELPKELSKASFSFKADEEQMSIFGCSPRDLYLYIKHEGLPIFNLDGSKEPKSFRNITRTNSTRLQLKSDVKTVYFNLTNPSPGCYYIAATLPYSDPKHEAIQPGGLSAECYAFVEAKLHVEKELIIVTFLEGVSIESSLSVGSYKLYKFYVPEIVSHATIIVDSLKFGNTEKLTLLIKDKTLPNENNTSNVLEIVKGSLNINSLGFTTNGGAWHYLRFEPTGSDENDNLTFRFSVKFFFEDFQTDLNNSKRIYRSHDVTHVQSYQQFDLVRESTTESFTYSFELPQNGSFAINTTSEEFVVLKYKIRPHTDIGGALQFTLAFKPRVNRAKRLIEPEPPAHTILACISQTIQLPSKPNWCVGESERTLAPIELNSTKTNTSMVMAFPESGIWYASFKLFCGDCKNCNCSETCRGYFTECVQTCERDCFDSEKCYNCSYDCKQLIIRQTGCEGCNCEGGCLKTGKACNTSVLYDLSSIPCVGNCGKNGRCLYMVSDGVVYTSCDCSNNYRGWDCGDNSNATPFGMVVLELILLVVSNAMFLPAVFLAYKRRYYVEAICYFSIFFFSTFYHACDAGENLISFCLTRMQALQFGDFYCALLSIWVTLVAIADPYPPFWRPCCQIFGAIVLAFITTINKTAAWVFIVPASGGVFLIGLCWFLKWRLNGRRMFINRRYLFVYLPLGLVVGLSGIAIFTFFETTNNYKYLHSMWHVIMSVTVMILLPKVDTFKSGLLPVDTNSAD